MEGKKRKKGEGKKEEEKKKGGEEGKEKSRKEREEGKEKKGKEEKERTWANDKAGRRQAITVKLLGASQLRQ